MMLSRVSFSKHHPLFVYRGTIYIAGKVQHPKIDRCNRRAGARREIFPKFWKRSGKRFSGFFRRLLYKLSHKWPGQKPPKNQAAWLGGFHTRLLCSRCVRVTKPTRTWLRPPRHSSSLDRNYLLGQNPKPRFRPAIRAILSLNVASSSAVIVLGAAPDAARLCAITAGSSGVSTQPSVPSPHGTSKKAWLLKVLNPAISPRSLIKAPSPHGVRLEPGGAKTL